ncbi:UNVERIFIED_CONTAM: Pentatricopeptide repeat-containing protein, mitochondrial [Sesamum latifolium]|uniref:Pentatricopeptide repeat-containing protein, mitochondrial n=1 Tax=Sesamum latifolium TaxID=2727402 RepID=A0AAW2UEL7_9LAMI
MRSSITSKTRHFRLYHSVVLSRLLYHTSPRRNHLFAPKPTSESVQNRPKSDLFTSPTATCFNYSDFELDTVLEALNCYANDWKVALEFFNWVEAHCGFQHTTQTFNRIVDILAIDVFCRLDEYNLRDETSFSNLIDALCEYKHVIEAKELCFKKNRDNEFDGKLFGFSVESTKIYNMILRGWFKMKWWRKCREFWEEMDTRGVKKDLYSYSIYMDIQCKCGKPWKAVKLYKEMRKKGIQLDVVAYNTVIHAIGISEGVDMAVRLYKEMAANQMLMIGSGVPPRMDTYVMLMRKFGRWGFLRPVFLVWKKMAEHGLSPDEFAYNALVDALLHKGLVDMARKYERDVNEKAFS